MSFHSFKRAVLVLGCLASVGAAAQTFPSKPVRILVPYAPGATSDLVPRLLGERMGSDLGQPVVVENKPGGLGLPAINDVLNNPADGHTLIAADAAHWAVNPAMQPVNYDFIRDFAPISQTFVNGLLFYVSSTLNVNTLHEFIAYAKAHPGQLNYGTPGVGSVHQLALETFRAGLGLDFKHIPYKGGADAIQSALRGETQFGVNSQTAVMPQVRAGRLKIVAVTVMNRVKSAPELPTVGEVTGLQDFQFPGQQALFARAGTPRANIDRLNAAVRKAAPELAARVLEQAASELIPTTPEQVLEVMRGDIRRYNNAVKISGIKTQ